MQSRELRTGVQMKLPCINVHTHTEATKNAIREEDLRTEKTQNVLFFSEILLMTASLRLRWPHYSLRSYHVGPSKTFQISCCITVKEKKNRLRRSRHIRGPQTFSISHNWTMLARSAQWQMDRMRAKTRRAMWTQLRRLAALLETTLGWTQSGSWRPQVCCGCAVAASANNGARCLQCHRLVSLLGKKPALPLHPPSLPPPPCRNG